MAPQHRRYRGRTALPIYSPKFRKTDRRGGRNAISQGRWALFAALRKSPLRANIRPLLTAKGSNTTSKSAPSIEIVGAMVCVQRDDEKTDPRYQRPHPHKHNPQRGGVLSAPLPGALAGMLQHPGVGRLGPTPGEYRQTEPDRRFMCPRRTRSPTAPPSPAVLRRPPARTRVDGLYGRQCRPWAARRVGVGCVCEVCSNGASRGRRAEVGIGGRSELFPQICAQGSAFGESSCIRRKLLRRSR